MLEGTPFKILENENGSLESILKTVNDQAAQSGVRRCGVTLWRQCEDFRFALGDADRVLELR